MSGIWLPDSAKNTVGTVREPKGYDYAVISNKLKACPPDKYIVGMADDVILAAEEWIDLVDYDKVVVPSMPPGEVHLLRKVDL
jgi:hypothetical protein